MGLRTAYYLVCFRLSIIGYTDLHISLSASPIEHTASPSESHPDQTNRRFFNHISQARSLRIRLWRGWVLAADLTGGSREYRQKMELERELAEELQRELEEA